VISERNLFGAIVAYDARILERISTWYLRFRQN
jgi:hypothetical protein